MNHKQTITMDNNNLSPELRDEITNKAAALVNARNYNNPGWNAGFHEGYETGATKYASKWEQSEAQNKQLREALERITTVCRKAEEAGHTSGLLMKIQDLAQLPSEEKQLEPDVYTGDHVAEKKKALAAKIDARLKEIGMQRQQFAIRMGVSPSVVTKWLSGTNNFQLDTLFEIERQLNFALLDYSMPSEGKEVENETEKS